MYLWGEPVTRSGGQGAVRELAAHRQYLKLPPRGGRGDVREAGAYSAIFRHKVAFSS